MIAVEQGSVRESYKGPACVTIRGRQLIEERIADIRERRLAELAQQSPAWPGLSAAPAHGESAEQTAERAEI